MAAVGTIATGAAHVGIAHGLAIGGAAAAAAGIGVYLVRKKKTAAPTPINSDPSITGETSATKKSKAATATAASAKTTVPVPHPTAYSYTVRAGNTLSGIAATDRTTVEELQYLNGIIHPNAITIGQKLYLPHAWPVPGPSGSKSSSNSTSSSRGGVAASGGTHATQINEADGIGG